MTYPQAVAQAFLLALPMSRGAYLRVYGGDRIWQLLCLRKLTACAKGTT